jgi:hypothetical protein
MKPPRSGVRTGSSGIGAEGLLDDHVRVITHAREWRRCLLPTAGFARKQPFLSQVGAFSFKQALLHENPFSWRAEPCAQPQAVALASLPCKLRQSIWATDRWRCGGRGYRALQRHTPRAVSPSPPARMCRRRGAIPPQCAILSHPLGSRLHLIAQDCAIWPLGRPASGS